MNLFLLSLDRKQCVRWYADKHIVKMILELAQLLYGVWGVSEHPDWRQMAPEGGYKTTHINHPIAVWMRQSKNNYNFAASYAYPMLEEYTRRYGKIHGCQKHLYWLITNVPPMLPDEPLTQMPQAMPDEYKVRDRCGTMEDTILAYKAYYIGFKVKNIKITYTNTEWPEWLPQQDPEEFRLYKQQQKIQTDNEKFIKQQIRSAKKLYTKPSIIHRTYLTLNIIQIPNPKVIALNVLK